MGWEAKFCFPGELSTVSPGVSPGTSKEVRSASSEGSTDSTEEKTRDPRKNPAESHALREAIRHFPILPSSPQTRRNPKYVCPEAISFFRCTTINHPCPTPPPTPQYMDTRDVVYAGGVVTRAHQDRAVIRAEETSPGPWLSLSPVPHP